MASPEMPPINNNPEPLPAVEALRKELLEGRPITPGEKRKPMKTGEINEDWLKHLADLKEGTKDIQEKFNKWKEKPQA